MTVWPEYHNDWSRSVLDAYRSDYFIYVSEAAAGSIGDKGFQELLEVRWLDVEQVKMPALPNIRSSLITR